MKFPIFASFILFLVWLTFVLMRTKRKDEKAFDAFWDKEERANNTRKKPLGDLPYIEIPFDAFPFSLIPDNCPEEISECHRIINGFHDKKAVNLTGITNTDLKLQYGAPNIKVLTEYDQNYTILVRTLQKWADLLISAGYPDEAVPLMEFCIDTRTDISATYRILAGLYQKEHDTEKLAHLRETAESLNSAMRPAIIRILDEAQDDSETEA